MVPASSGGSTRWYLPYLLFIAGIGGLLCGIDLGVIAAALLYLEKTVSLSESQISIIVAAVLAGCTMSSLVAGVLSDWIGRKRMMVVSGLLFVVSILCISTSQGFVPLCTGRLLMGLSAGVSAVVIPLYLVECLPSTSRGRGIAVFQFMLTFGIVVAALVGVYFTKWHDLAVEAAEGDAAKILAADNAAWRGMFLVAIVPGIIFTLGTLALKESPRWLFRRGHRNKARSALRLSRTIEQVELEMEEMEQHAASQKASGKFADSLLRRKYVVPFLITCIVLACNQATGINSVLQYTVIILKQVGMSDILAANSDLIVKILNCVLTLVGVALVDRMGRKFLLKMGTAGIIIALGFAGLLCRGFESLRVDVRDQVAARVTADGRELSMRMDGLNYGSIAGQRPMQLSVLYRYDNRQGVAAAFSNDKDPVVAIKPAKGDEGRLAIERALYGPIPSKITAWLITAALCLFICSFSAGPGVCVWLVLSELMPTRIRSLGMGVAMLLNALVSTVIAGVFLPLVGNYGYSAMFFFWASCTVIYFLTVTFFLPETTGETLEEIEAYFENQ